MKIFAFSTYEEACQTIAQTGAKASGEHFVFTSESGISCAIVVTGIGPFAAYTTLEHFMDTSCSIINLGIAGAINRALKSGVVYPIAQASKLCWHPKKSSITSPQVVQASGFRLVTVDFPLRQAKTRDELQPQFDLVDMEGYAIARLAARHNKPLQLYKVVSDYCDEHTGEAIQKNLPHLSKLLADATVSLLHCSD